MNERTKSESTWKAKWLGKKETQIETYMSRAKMIQTDFGIRRQMKDGIT